MIINISVFHSNLSIVAFKASRHICRILLKNLLLLLLFILIYLLVLVAVAAVLVLLGKRNSRRIHIRLDGNNQRPAFSNVSLDAGEYFNN